MDSKPVPPTKHLPYFPLGSKSEHTANFSREISLESVPTATHNRWNSFKEKTCIVATRTANKSNTLSEDYLRIRTTRKIESTAAFPTDSLTSSKAHLKTPKALAEWVFAHKELFIKDLNKKYRSEISEIDFSLGEHEAFIKNELETRLQTAFESDFITETGAKLILKGLIESHTLAQLAYNSSRSDEGCSLDEVENDTPESSQISHLTFDNNFEETVFAETSADLFEDLPNSEAKEKPPTCYEDSSTENLQKPEKPKVNNSSIKREKGKERMPSISEVEEPLTHGASKTSHPIADKLIEELTDLRLESFFADEYWQSSFDEAIKTIASDPRNFGLKYQSESSRKELYHLFHLDPIEAFDLIRETPNRIVNKKQTRQERPQLKASHSVRVSRSKKGLQNLKQEHTRIVCNSLIKALNACEAFKEKRMEMTLQRAINYIENFQNYFAAIYTSQSSPEEFRDLVTNNPIEAINIVINIGTVAAKENRQKTLARGLETLLPWITEELELEVRQVADDGDCLSAAIACQLPTQKSAVTLREEGAEWLSHYVGKSIYVTEPFKSEERDSNIHTIHIDENLIQHVRISATAVLKEQSEKNWGNDDHLAIFAIREQRPVIIFTGEGIHIYEPNPREISLAITHHFYSIEDRYKCALDIYAFLQDTITPIYLIHTSDEAHYHACKMKNN